MSRTRKRIPKKKSALEGIVNPKRSEILLSKSPLTDSNKKKPAVMIHNKE
jgi:hypothetical protein